jgi:hypothetical protein
MCWCCGHDDVRDHEESGGIDRIDLRGTISLKTQTLDQMSSTHTMDNNAINDAIKKTCLILLLTVFSFNKIK